jgi:hypothetical protein
MALDLKKCKFMCLIFFGKSIEEKYGGRLKTSFLLGLMAIIGIQKF